MINTSGIIIYIMYATHFDRSSFVSWGSLQIEFYNLTIAQKRNMCVQWQKIVLTLSLNKFVLHTHEIS